MALSSPEGQARFASAMANLGTKSFFHLIEQFTTQPEPAFCGISTLVIILNALAIDPRKAWKGPWRWYEESILNCCLDMDQIKETGITMNDFRCLAICQGLTARVVRVEDLLAATTIEGTETGEGADTEDVIQEFRAAVKAACISTNNIDNTQNYSNDNNNDNNSINRKNEYLVVSYSRKVLGQTGSGHFSPIAAYDAASDSVLILDTARFKYGAHWVSVPLLFRAMIPKDPDTGKSRGFILLSDHDDDDEQQQGQKTRHENNHHATTADRESSLVRPSVLFRSQRKQNPVRRDYKKFLRDIEARVVSFDQVALFWTKAGTKSNYIWQMLEPQFSPLQEDEAAMEMIGSLRKLIHDLMTQTPHTPLPDACCHCRVNYSRTIDITPREAIFCVYLASLNEDKRRKLVLSVGSNQHATSEQTQLLAEAELIRYAIEMSDETCEVEEAVLPSCCSK